MANLPELSRFVAISASHEAAVCLLSAPAFLLLLGACSTSNRTASVGK
jgi:hypothetical protein